MMQISSQTAWFGGCAPFRAVSFFAVRCSGAEHRLGPRQFAMAAALANVGAKILPGASSGCLNTRGVGGNGGGGDNDGLFHLISRPLEVFT